MIVSITWYGFVTVFSVVFNVNIPKPNHFSLIEIIVTSKKLDRCNIWTVFLCRSNIERPTNACKPPSCQLSAPCSIHLRARLLRLLSSTMSSTSTSPSRDPRSSWRPWEIGSKTATKTGYAFSVPYCLPPTTDSVNIIKNKRFQRRFIITKCYHEESQ